MTDPDILDRDVKRYVELDALRADIQIELDAIKERLRDGGTQTAPCGIKVTVSANRRFNSELAAQLIPAPLLDLCTRTVIDSTEAKKALPPAIYDSCMIEVGAPRVTVR